MKPNINIKDVAYLQYKLGKEGNINHPEYIELVDEEDILQPLLLISKMCVLNLRRRAIREQTARREEFKDKDVRNSDERYQADKRSWGIDIGEQAPGLERAFNHKLNGLCELAQVEERNRSGFVGAFEADMLEKLNLPANRDLYKKFNALNRTIAAARNKLNDSENPITDEAGLSLNRQN